LLVTGDDDFLCMDGACMPTTDYTQGVIV